MKKYFFLMALLAIAPLSLISCGDDDEADSGGSTPAVTLPVPTNKNDAAKFTVSNASAKVNGRLVTITGVEFTESGNYIMTYRETAATRDGSFNLGYYMGTYLLSGDSEYTLSDFGEIVIKGKSGNEYVLLIRPASEDEFETPATKWNDIASGTETDYLCREWTVINTRIMGTVNNNGKQVKLGRDFPGKCDLNQLIDYAIENGANITDHIDDNSIIQGINFTQAGTYCIRFNRSTYDVGTWRWSDMSKGTLTYTWDDPKAMGNPLESGYAQVAFANNQCKLTLKTTISEFDIQVIYTLQ